MSTADQPPYRVNPLAALHDRVRTGQEPCRECRSAPAIYIHQRFQRDTDALDVNATHRALCAGCSANAARAGQAFAARQALVDQWQTEVRTSLATLRSSSTKLR